MIDTFKDIASNAGRYFKKDELNLDFSGYSDFLKKYQDHNNYDAEELNEILKEAILWNDYISEALNNINVLLFSEMIDFEAMKCNYVKNDILIKSKLKIDSIKSLKRELYIQKQLCMNIYYTTMKTYEKSMKAFTINDYFHG